MKLIKQVVKSSLTLMASHLGKHQATTSEPYLWVLMYHRILPKADPRFHIEEPGMVITPETFEMHINEASKLFEIVSLSEWLTKASNGEPLPQKACAITFDDGWADNFEYALPLLKKHNVPATLFAVADKIGTKFRFWPNIVSELIYLQTNVLANHSMFSQAFDASKKTFSIERVASVIQSLKQHSEDEIFTALESIDWQGVLKDSAPALMSWVQLKEMQQSGLVEVGSHTCTHRRLDKGLSQELLEFEIAKSNDKLTAQIQTTPPLFCFPNGDYNEAALDLVKSNYRGAVTTAKGINKLTSLKQHELYRIALHEDGSNTPTKFRARLSSWSL